MTRQNYYARRRQRQQRQVDGELVAELVRQERQVQPRLGVRKLRWMLAPALAAAGVRLGRDRMFAELRVRGLLVPPLPSQWPRTTQFSPSLPVFQNRIKGQPAKVPNEVWVGDLTYVRTAEGFLFLSLLTDQYSRKIVGYHAGETLAASGCMLALEMALLDLPQGCKPTHHSDRGCQYCSHEYVGRLQRQDLPISMTEEDHCAQNALAERMNGILKQEYGLGGVFTTKAQGRKAVIQAVHLYNTRRPHTSLAYLVPAVVHRQQAVAKN
jgi:transposase InsO family protein